jgi:hypothetical protein
LQSGYDIRHGLYTERNYADLQSNLPLFNANQYIMMMFAGKEIAPKFAYFASWLLGKIAGGVRMPALRRKALLYYFHLEASAL